MSVWKSTSRVDGVKRPKFDFHAASSTVVAAEHVILDLDQRKGSTRVVRAQRRDDVSAAVRFHVCSRVDAEMTRVHVGHRQLAVVFTAR